MCELKRISAPATRAQSLLETVKFAHGMLGVTLSDISNSKRLSGVVADQLGRKRATVQRSPLTVAQ
eukprot:2514336-Amphidinium_carterae.1